MENVQIERLIPGGQGIGTLSSGKKILLWGGLPGEIVEFQITKNKASYCEAIVTNVVEPSKYRVMPKDPCYLATSPWQIMDYAYGLEQKTLLVQECFRQNHLDLPSMNPTVTDGKAYYYRNKMEYSLYWNHDTAKIDLAFHERGTHRKIPIHRSSLERPEIFQAASEIAQQLNHEHQSARDYQAILVRCDQAGQTSAALFQKRQPHPQMPPLTDELLGYKYSYSPNGFFQINLPVYALALAAIKKHVTTPKVLDLYAGVGTIGLSVARDRELTLVEVDKSAYTELTKNCPPSAHPILAKSEAVLEFIAPDATVILDPPRAGCAPELINQLANVKPPTIIYLSCNPVTQARDLAPLLEHYQINLCQTFNFFPRTPHIENLIILERK